MGHVRKDILNGWKEIGGYVCRDIRTVERWEKQRGLPVRRVPGAGRATVYALIPEVDEWLSKTKLSDDSGDDVKIHILSRSEAMLQSEVMLASGAHSVPEMPQSSAEVLSGETELRASSPAQSAEPLALRPPDSRPSPWWLRRPHGQLLARVAIVGSVALLAAVSWPLMVQARRDKPAGFTSSHTTPEPRELPVSRTSVPYRSRVPGVDDLYLSGMYFYEQRTSSSLQRSLEDFNAAIAKDPNYAPAYAGLANTYNLLRQYSHMPDAEAYPKAKAAAEHAIALDPNLPQAHASLGFIDFFWSWNAAESEKEFRKAIALDPTSVLAHHWYGSILAHEARFPEAIEQLDVAQHLEPTSTAVLSIRALAVGMNGHRDQAIGSLNDVIRTAPPSTSPHFVLATLSLMEPRDLRRFLAETLAGAVLRNDDIEVAVLKSAQTAYRSGGEHAMWARILSEEERHHPDRFDRTYSMAQAEAALGRNDAALADFTQLADRREPSVMGVLMDPILVNLRQDRSFPELLAKIGLPLPPPATQR